MNISPHSESVISPPASNGQRVANVLLIRRFLDRVRQRARRWIWVETFSQVGLTAAFWFWTTLLLDWLIEPPPGVRVLAVIMLIGLLFGLLSLRLIGRLRTHLRDEPLALLVERTHPVLADSLSTTIELNSKRANTATPIDAELLDRTTATAADALHQVRIPQLFQRKRLLRLAGLSGFAVGTVMAVLVLAPELREIWWRRLICFDEKNWPRRVTLEVANFPGGLRRVARGSDVDIDVIARTTSDLPTIVELRSRGSGAWTTARMGTRGGRRENSQAFGHTLRDIGEDLTLEVRGGDARLRGLRIVAVEPPTLEELKLTVTPPAYIGGTARALPATRLVEVPAAAKVTLTATATKPLSQGIIQELPTNDNKAAANSRVLATFTSSPQLTKKQGEGKEATDAQRQLTGTIPEVLTDCVLDILFTDTTGISNQQPIRFQLLARPDDPPQLRLELDGISTAITPTAVIPIVGTIEDDHGLNTAAVQIQRLASGETEPDLTQQSIPLNNTPTVATFNQDSPAAIAVTGLSAAVGDRLEMTVSATDCCGLTNGPQESRTEPWSLEVVSPEKLLAMLEAREVILRRRFESVLADFQKTRDWLATSDSEDPAASSSRSTELVTGRLSEATNRASGETAEIELAFREIAHELSNNSLLTAELEARLVRQIATPLAKIVSGALARLADECRTNSNATDKHPPITRLLALTDTCLEELRAVLDKMIELETFNEVVDSLRKLIEQQEAIQKETEQQRKQRARNVLRGL